MFNQTEREQFSAVKLVTFYKCIALGYAIILTLTVIVIAVIYKL